MGKSSLLDALTVLLSPKPELYHFNKLDFYHAWNENKAKKRDLQIILIFCENQIGEHRERRLRHFHPMWVGSMRELKRICSIYPLLVVGGKKNRSLVGERKSRLNVL
ncbi:DUF2813 domain-containing protein [Xenorhabdus nematophila]|uniref:Uncharacterized protein n=1 Tax=Xenorhabdus nematophila (strain ATCC 19061 / DSM 3370 / CCUG 14189 / LMG 1036 / NCIMB 9965 / AN6) TaxID=406817 RepID=D3VBG3_XENNA|nr:DUF2813 domain-containing protein [Xenorhabdus nematophila]CEE94760.1 hypothetical protein XNA1_4800032 [Xenorhabdus nematophila str. Anatoliense]CEF33034.1 hypothetical protein XNW1_460032 [Xenorhabdus nematophila str. Websteri]AYA40726.1 DUF2813 domain-containing protein [Xenorhabdus nematophila]KHD28485.1 hypothetical protein LH67_10305 [Xenorhabdus nematophila]MBA0019466.1 DUF2813 domain-containing protein [Xenorhabdus nematophila]